MKLYIWLLLGTLTSVIFADTWDKDFWYQQNEAELVAALKTPNTNKAKNLVLAIGDGMGVTTTTAIRVYRGQLTPGMLGEEALLSWDKFPHTGMSKTYSTDMTTTDSAASATAYHCGVKTKFEAVGVDDKVQRGICSTVAGATVKSLLDLALAEGKSVGIVTTDAVVGASPSGAYAHAAFRNWRSDKELPDDAKGVCKDIARQLVEDNLDIQVVLGGGRKYFRPNSLPDPEDKDENGDRLDGKNLPQEWLKEQVLKKRKAKFVIDQLGFDQVTAENTDYLFGLFAPSRMQQETTRRINKTEPSLAEMTEKAIQILQKNDKGFYLFVEGANIDVGHHESRARYALEEGLALDDAVRKVTEMTSSEDTLVVVSADHSHAFSFGGYSSRGQSILSIANNSYFPFTDETGRHYTVLSYGNGPGYKNESDRVNYTKEYFNVDRVYESTFPLDSETHGGEDVQIFASGPMSHIFTGTHEQTFLAHGMAYAACIGRNRGHCQEELSSTTAATTTATTTPGSANVINMPHGTAFIVTLAAIITNIIL